MGSTLLLRRGKGSHKNPPGKVVGRWRDEEKGKNQTSR